MSSDVISIADAAKSGNDPQSHFGALLVRFGFGPMSAKAGDPSHRLTRGLGPRRCSSWNYSRDLRPTKWGLTINSLPQLGYDWRSASYSRRAWLVQAGGRERQSRLSGLVDFCHCGRRGARDRAYRTISPSSDRQTTGASTDKISHPTSMRSPETFLSPS